MGWNIVKTLLAMAMTATVAVPAWYIAYDRWVEKKARLKHAEYKNYRDAASWPVADKIGDDHDEQFLADKRKINEAKDKNKMAAQSIADEWAKTFAEYGIK